MAAPWVRSGRRDDGRRSLSPPYMHRRRDSPPRRDSYDWPYNEPYDRSYHTGRRSSDGTNARPNGPPYLSDRDHHQASTYRPRYDQRKPDHTPPVRRHTEGGANGASSSTAKIVPNKVWVNPEYRKRQQQQRTQAQIDGAADCDQSSKATDASSKAPSILRIETQPASTSEMTESQTNRDQPKESSPMDLDSNTSKSAAEEASNQSGNHAINATRPASKPSFVSFATPSATTRPAEQAQDDQQPHAPHSWLRPKRKVTQSSDDPVTPSSPVLPREPPNRIAEILHNFFSASSRSRAAQQELEKLEKLHAQHMKDLRLIHGSEMAAAKKAHTSLEVVSMMQKKTLLQRDAASGDELSRLSANQLSDLINSSLKSDDIKGPPNLESELVEIRKENKGLKDANVKLELRLAKLEASTKIAHISSGQLAEVKGTIASVNSDVSSLVRSKDDIVKRLLKCEADIDDVKTQALSISKSTSEFRKFSDLQQCHEKSIQELRSHLDEMSTQHDSLQSKVDYEVAQMKGFEPASLIQANTFVTQTLAELKERLSKAEIDQVALRENATGQLNEQQKFEALDKRVTGLDKKLEAGEADFSFKMNQLRSEVQVLRTRVADHHAHISRTLTSLPPGSNGRPNVQSPGMQVPTGPMSGNPQPFVPSQSHTTHQTHGTAVTNPQQRPTSGGAWSPPGQQVTYSGQTPVSQWHSGAYAPASPGYQFNPNEIMQRTRTLEQFVQSHEHRLNFTTIESCWAPLVQHVMKHIGENYRYPESVSRALSELQRTAQAHSETLKEILQQFPEARNVHSAQESTTTLRLKDQLEEQAVTIRSLQSGTLMQSSAIKSLQTWTEDGFQDAVASAISAEMTRMEDLRKDLEERMQNAVDDFMEGATQAREASAMMQKCGAKHQVTNAGDIEEKIERLGTDLHDLEKFLFAEIPKLHGLIAGLKPVHSTAKRPAAHMQESAAQNGPHGEGGSSSESVLDSMRKRKRKMAG